MIINFRQLDIFTDKIFSGNPAGVIHLEQDIEGVVKQRIANELNLSETVFVSNSDKADFKLEYFTPVKQIDLAGHPTIAACYSLALENKLFLNEPVTTLNFETGKGVIPCQLHIDNGSISRVVMEQKQPQFKPFAEEGTLLNALQIQESSLLADYPIEFVSTGLECLIVPAADLATVQDLFPDFNRLPWHTLVFANEAVSPIATVHLRFFAPKLGIAEDPATGTASGALGAYLIKHKIIRGASPVTMVFEQGLEISRPSEITVEISFNTSDDISNVKVGGKAALAAEGKIYL